MKAKRRASEKALLPQDQILQPERILEVTGLQHDLIRKVARTLTDRDKVIVVAAQQLARDRYENGRHHLAACGWGKYQAEHYSALQINCKRAREASVCAEAGVLIAASMKGDEVLTIVTFHGNHVHNGKHGPYVVPPCSLCAARLRRFAPNCEVIIEFEGDLVKIPQTAFMLIPYPMIDLE
ncbi:MAG: hypothetical protein HYW65_03555 [Candidatus Liptonbacteria bacterium]|nr:hypothetical protein [Candidatus Liptonbacteria bacterium]